MDIYHDIGQFGRVLTNYAKSERPSPVFLQCCNNLMYVAYCLSLWQMKDKPKGARKEAHQCSEMIQNLVEFQNQMQPPLLTPNQQEALWRELTVKAIVGQEPSDSGMSNIFATNVLLIQNVPVMELPSGRHVRLQPQEYEPYTHRFCTYSYTNPKNSQMVLTTEFGTWMKMACSAVVALQDMIQHNEINAQQYVIAKQAEGLFSDVC